MTENGEKEEIIELIGDNGDTLKLVHIGTINYENEIFVFFQPTDEESDEVAVFKKSLKNGEEVLLPIEDEKLLDKVFEEFVKIYDDEEEED